jgi:hypothetical protein
VYNAPPPSDATLIGSIAVGHGYLARVLEFASHTANEWARISRFLPIPP